MQPIRRHVGHAGMHPASFRSPKENGPQGPVFTVVHLAEPEGFEPSMQVLPTYSLSRGAPSATRSQLRRIKRGF
jgi:hypothetical protein